MQRIKYLICYDICHPKRLRKVHRCIRDWGMPIQYSVFEVTVYAQQLEKLLNDLKAMIDNTEDKINVYQLGQQTERRTLGIAQEMTELMYL